MIALSTILAAKPGEIIGTVVFVLFVVISWAVQAYKQAQDKREREERMDSRRAGQQSSGRSPQQASAVQSAPPAGRRRRRRPPAQPVPLDEELAVPAAVPEPEPKPAEMKRPTPVKTRKPKINLNPKNARVAIILHEVLSPPKALQKGDAMWDS